MWHTHEGRWSSPVGTTVMLFDAAGGPLNSGNNFGQTMLDDGAATSIQDVTLAEAPFTGTFRPANAMSASAGVDASGTWILNVSDSTFTRHR